MATYSNIYIDQGSSYSSVIKVKDSNKMAFNLSGYAARGHIRRSYTSSNFVAFSTTISDTESGEITINLTPLQTKAMKPGRYVYDVEIFHREFITISPVPPAPPYTQAIDDPVIRVAEGQVEISAASTRIS